MSTNTKELKCALLKNFLDNFSNKQHCYFRAHKKTRNVVERGIGQLKRRFHVLPGEIRVTPPAKVCQIIEVCAMLHNICKERNIQMPAEEDINMLEEDDPQPVTQQPRAAERPREGLQYRDEFVHLHFK